MMKCYGASFACSAMGIILSFGFQAYVLGMALAAAGTVFAAIGFAIAIRN